MSTVDPEIKDRLSHAVDPMELDVEARLGSVRVAAGRRSAGRRAAAIAVALALAAVAVLAASRLLPRGEALRPGGDVGPRGRIAYTRATQADAEGSDLFVVDAASGETTVLYDGPGFAVYPLWSPDGSRIAYAADEGGNGLYGVYVAKADASDPVKILDRLGTFSFSWSPDGSQLAYLRRDAQGVVGLHVVNADGTGGTLVLEGEWQAVSWSPDGQRLLLAGYPENERGGSEDFDLFTVRPDGTDLVRLTDDELYEHFPRWSPDGSRIAFAASGYIDDVDYPSDLYVMNADGSGLTQLTDWRGFDSLPVWSPDGEWIAFASDRAASPAQQRANREDSAFVGISLHVMRADGSDVDVLVSGGDAAVLPSDWAV